MNPQERQAAIEALERKLLDTLDEYVTAINKKIPEIQIHAIYDRIQKLQQEKQRLKNTK